jgi:hypothetical protein
LIISATFSIFYHRHVLLLQRHAERNVTSQVAPLPTNTVLSWIIGIKSIFDGVPQTASQGTGVTDTSNVDELMLDNPLAAHFIQIHKSNAFQSITGLLSIDRLCSQLHNW